MKIRKPLRPQRERERERRALASTYEVKLEIPVGLRVVAVTVEEVRP